MELEPLVNQQYPQYKEDGNPGFGLQPYLLLCFFRLDAQGGMGNHAEAFFGNQLTRFTTDTVCAIFNADQRFFQMVNIADLAGGVLIELFALQRTGAVFQTAETAVAFVVAVTAATADLFLEVLQFLTCGGELAVNQLFKFFEFLFGIAQLLGHLYRSFNRFNLKLLLARPGFLLDEGLRLNRSFDAGKHY